MEESKPKSESKPKKKSKTKKRKDSLRKKIAKEAYLDPGSSTFLEKSKSVLKAGYSEVVSQHDASKILDNSTFTDADYRKIELYVSDLPQIQSLLSQVHKELKASGTISAKSHANLIKELEMKAKMLGIMKQYIEKRELVVNVTIPLSKCPNCGYEMDIMKREYEGGEKNG